MPDLATNKKALFDYDILEKFEAGLVLTGPEVKSVKEGQINLKGAYVTFHKNEGYLLNAYIAPYKPAGPRPDYDPYMSRKVLLRGKELRYLQGKSGEKALTIVPIRVYTKNRLVKVEIAVGRGRKSYDKRDVIKKRDLDKELRRDLKI